MQLASALRLIGGWAPFSRLPQKLQARLAESLQALKLRPGQKLYDFGDLPPGVALVVGGQMRLLALDERNEPFTLRSSKARRRQWNDICIDFFFG